MQYDEYITEFFDEQKHLSSTPVSVHEFYENEFLGYAEEKEFSWKLYVDTLQYSFSKKEDYKVEVTLDEVVFSFEVPEDIYNGDDHALTKYIDDTFGETIFGIICELQNPSSEE